MLRRRAATGISRNKEAPPDLLTKVDANACLALAVPDPVIGSLVRVK